MPDPTFTDIVVPGAKAALDWAKNASPLKDCKKVRALFLRAWQGSWRRSLRQFRAMSSERLLTDAVSVIDMVGAVT